MISWKCVSRLLKHDHVERSCRAASNFSFSLVPRSSLKSRGVFLATQLAAVFVGDDPLQRPRILHLLVPRVQTILRLRGFVGLAPNNLSDPCSSSIRRSGKPGGALNGSVPSSSVSSDSHDSVGVRHGFLSLGTVFQAGSVIVSHRNISSSSRDTPSRPPSLFQHHGSIHDSVHQFFFHHGDMPYKA